MAYKITGTVLAISPILALKSKSGSDYKKRDLIITVRLFDQYTGQPKEDIGNTPKFTFIGEKCHDLDQFKIGDVIVVHFDINGRSYERDGRIEYYTEVRPFRIDYNNRNTNLQQLGNQEIDQYPQSSICENHSLIESQPPQTIKEELPF